MEFITDPKGHKATEGRCMHIMGSTVVTHITGDDATANSYNILLMRDGEQTYISTAGNNQWTLKRVNDKWLLKERRRRNIGGEGYQGNVDATSD